jgi:hypothetical protein
MKEGLMRIASIVIGFVLATLIEIGAYADSPCTAAPALTHAVR